MDRQHRPSRWERAELIVKLVVALAGAGYTVAEAIEMLSHVHW
jgi:hypothetical protein